MKPTAACATCAFCVVSLIAGCGGFKPITADSGSEPDFSFPAGTDLAGVVFDLSTPPANADLATPIGGTGPGPYGALPTGYCCTSNNDCRARSCVPVMNGMMCADTCGDDSACVGRLTPFHCDMTSMLCAPINANYQCVPSSMFVRGTKPLGACCTATHDGNAGNECLGGRCDGFGDDSNPYICTNACEQAVDCPGNYNCLPVNPYSVCAPAPNNYTCM